MGDTQSEEKPFIPRKKPLSRRVTGYAKPTKSPRQKWKEEYEKERAKRRKCRESNPSPETCAVCLNEHRCPAEATEDWINKQKQNEPQE